MDLAVIYLEDFNFSLPEERNCLLPIDDPQGFVRCVEQKGHFHAITSFQPRLLVSEGLGIVLERVASLCHKPRSKSSYRPVCETYRLWRPHSQEEGLVPCLN